MWTVRVFKMDNRNEIVIKTKNFTSRAQCADELKNWPKAHTTRDNYNRTYHVRVG